MPIFFLIVGRGQPARSRCFSTSSYLYGFLFHVSKDRAITDAYLGKVKRLNALHYMLFVMLFPQLIAGPIVHHSEVMPQFAARRCVEMSDVALGLTIFVGGLAKKVLFADGAAQFATPVFDAARRGHRADFRASMARGSCLYGAALL